jgi:hypothetical protein
MGQLFDFILAGVGMDEIGSASGVLQAVQQLSSAVGVAALGTIFFSAFAGHPPTHALAITAWACLVPVAATFGPAPGAARTVPRPRSRPVHGAAGDSERGTSVHYAWAATGAARSPPLLLCLGANLDLREVQRSVQPDTSRQYQRTSAHPLPPSATISVKGRWIAHSQQVSTAGWGGRATLSLLAAMIGSPPEVRAPDPGWT